MDLSRFRPKRLTRRVDMVGNLSKGDRLGVTGGPDVDFGSDAAFSEIVKETAVTMELLANNDDNVTVDHYTTCTDKSSFDTLWPGTAATLDDGLTSGEAGSGLGIDYPTVYYGITFDPTSTDFEGTSPIEPSNSYPEAGQNGEQQVIFTNGTTPGQVIITGPFPVAEP